ncbi:MAG: hypothetical protein ABIR70_07045 [Bryobacteraceae bacterium]
MRRLQQLALVGALAFVGMAQAQNRNGNFGNGGFRGNDRYPQGQNQRFDVIDRAQADVNRLAGLRLDKRDFGRVNDLTRNLREFEQRMSQGRFDKGKLDHIIETMDHLADSNRIPPAARTTLYRDVQDLRQYRANRGYDGGNGYRY